MNGRSTSCSGEARWLSRMVRNLLENARRHSGGVVVRVHVEPTASRARLIDEDDGAGVPVELRERIFEPFFRPAGMRESHDRGVGVGLALVRQVARRHGGDVICQERDDGGNRFVVTLLCPTI